MKYVTYIVGMIVGAACCIVPVVYLMNFDRCLTQITLALPKFDTGSYNPVSLRLASGVIIIGAVVLLLSAAMMALTGLKTIKTVSDGPKEAP